MPKQDKVQIINQRRRKPTDSLGLGQAIIGGGPGDPATITLETDNSSGATHAHKLEVGALVSIGHIVLIQAATGELVDYSVADEDGLTAALAAATAGDVVWLPACEVSGDHVVPAGVTLRGLGLASVLTGQVTLGAGAEARDLAVTRDEDDAGDVVGVLAGGAAPAYLHNATVEAVNATGAGYAVAADESSLYVYGGTLIGSTAPARS